MGKDGQIFGNWMSMVKGEVHGAMKYGRDISFGRVRKGFLEEVAWKLRPKRFVEY